MTPLSRWWLRRRHRGGEWAALLQPPPAGEWVSLDLETTGMDPARDHILSLAAVPVRDGRVLLSERFERRIHTARAFGIDSIRHHRITPDEASTGEQITDVVRAFLHWLGSRRLLGYYLGFDLDMLGPHVRAANASSARTHRSTWTSPISPTRWACRWWNATARWATRRRWGCAGWRCRRGGGRRNDSQSLGDWLQSIEDAVERLAKESRPP